MYIKHTLVANKGLKQVDINRLYTKQDTVLDMVTFTLETSVVQFRIHQMATMDF